MTDISSLGLSIDTSAFSVPAEMMRLLELLSHIEDKPADEQVALIRSHVVATYEDAIEVASGETA
ncbi:hypothetical protein [Hyphomicrobium sulfonivorans]|nr:hypothetical protein [Hyphomicrobium sulfonivorans]